MANKKEIIRDQYIRIKMSKEEKDLWLEYSKRIGINPTRLARNIIMLEAGSFLSKIINIPVVKAYKYYLEKTNQKKELKKINSD